MNEMTRLERFRSEVPLPGPADLRTEESRLLDAMAHAATVRPVRGAGRTRRARRLRFGLVAGLAAAALTAGVAGVALHQKPAAPPVIHAENAAAARILTRAADNVSEAPELHPRPDQFLVFTSQTMNTVDSVEQGGRASHYLSRGKRTIWLPARGDATHGVIEEEVLKPHAYPGRPIPPEAYENIGRHGPEKAVDEDNTADYLRTDYAHLSRLPTDPAKMYEHLYIQLGTGPLADARAWDYVGGMLVEAYMPAAQRAALFRAAAMIHGVTVVRSATDAAGRRGIAVASTWKGLRTEYIFTPETYQFLGLRTVVVGPTRVKAPVGSVLTSTAQLSVSVADHAPKVKRR
ncbi:hypothetical protein GCM10027176_57930 [Actinoallomurus bryophytorum]|uniref:CU044_5270 family protein n=1 Tax=Actinoallomurus bryophytorum TaxID=1490222 RepID=A0A543CCV2_9ACTN|nr:CU044_5270 family protein [Actinoallomurus bryophytorum]TQL94926.1 hypothetical protein FB559_0414 [Actinoallomurus bryophytorum]